MIYWIKRDVGVLQKYLYPWLRVPGTGSSGSVSSHPDSNWNEKESATDTSDVGFVTVRVVMEDAETQDKED